MHIVHRHSSESTVALHTLASRPRNDAEAIDLHNSPSHSITSDFCDKPVRATASHRIGSYLIITNMVAGGALVLATSVLAFLWFGSDEGGAWRYIMIHGWPGQVVTLSTLIIRLAVATQASTAISMLASICLESKCLNGVALKDAPALSVSRCVNSGPLTTLALFRSNLLRKPHARISILIFRITLTTFLSQFTSTLLLWDVRPGSALSFSTTEEIAVGFSMQNYLERFSDILTRSQNYWLTSPQEYPAFAEFSGPAEIASPAVDDTGPSICAFLLLGLGKHRTALAHYSGPASVLDTRVACVRPDMPYWDFSRPHEKQFLAGVVRPSQIPEELGQALRINTTEPGIPFNCSLENLQAQSDPTFVVYGLPYGAGGLISSVDPKQNKTLRHHFSNRTWMALNPQTGSSWFVELGYMVLILRGQGKLARSEIRLSDFINYERPDGGFTTQQQGVWLDFISGPSRDTYRGLEIVQANMSITMCFDAM